jgi:hypothetical protein
MAEREVTVSEGERRLAKNRAELDAYDQRAKILIRNHDELEVLTNKHKSDLANSSFELEKSRFEMVKEQVANDALQMKKKLDEKDRECDVRVKLALDDQAAENIEATLGYQRKLAVAEAETQAKELIIASKDEEIVRLDQLLKVTMAKLTQIDLKGLTLHVDPITVAHNAHKE